LGCILNWLFTIMVFESFPFVVGWELTLACNLRCGHCGSSAGSPRKNELTGDECLKICDQFPELLVQEVNFTGGEPLLNPDWFDIALRLNELKIATKILTNGLLLDARTVTKIKAAGISGVGISIDGCENTHDRLRGQFGLFHEIKKSIERLHENNLQITVITTVHSTNVSELSTLRDILVSLGVKRWQVQPIFPLGRTLLRPELKLSKADYLQLGRFIKSYYRRFPGQGLEILPGDSFGYYTDMDPRKPIWRGCPAGFFSCGITSDGKVKGCLSLPDEIIDGDLRRNDLWDIWFHTDAFTWNRKFSNGKLGENCRGCEMGETCRGGCSAMSIGGTGSMHNDPYCFAALVNE